MAKSTIMLAETAKTKMIDPDAEYTISEKLDGQPAKIIRGDDGDLYAQSRQGKRITSVQHILDELNKNNLLPCTGDFAVGELYIKGQPVSIISGKVRKDEPCPELVWYVFDEFDKYIFKDDYFTPESIQDNTFVHVFNAIRHFPTTHMSGWEVLDLFSGEDIKEEQMDCIKLAFDKDDLIAEPEHFEGYIARDLSEPWTPNKRSKAYLKLLTTHTLDLLVTGFEEAVAGSDTFDVDPDSETFGKLLQAKGTKLGRVGAFVVSWKDAKGGTCKVGAGKLTHDLAKQFWEGYKAKDVDFSKMIIEVKYKPDPHYTSPRQPTFQRFRQDKDEYQTSFKE